MLKNIQNTLLLRHPLLWNIKIVPALLIMLALHIIFFIWGYINGAVDFSYYNAMSYDDTPGIAASIAVVTAIFLTVIWLVFYFRNNAFKSFYPKSAWSLYKEWLYILLISIVNCAYIFSFYLGEDIRRRGYFNETEVARRLDVISMASLFAEGGFEENGVTTEERNGKLVRIERDSFNYFYNKRDYQLKSLINKRIEDFSYQSAEKDSLNELKVKRWLIEGKKDSVLRVMTDFQTIAKSHQGKSNITPEKWLSLIYNAPEFTQYITIGREDKYPYSQSENYEEYTDIVTPEPVQVKEKLDTLSFSVKYIDGIEYVYPKYYVPMRQMVDAYNVISQAWSSPEASDIALVITLCFGFGVSLLILSFRVTSGRSWLFAAISLGIAAMVTGILNVIYLTTRSYSETNSVFEDFSYFVLWLIITAALTAYFFSIKTHKGNSGIIVNILLWLYPFVLPFIGFIIAESLRRAAKFDELRKVRITPVSPFEDFVLHMPQYYIAACLLIFTFLMYPFLKSVRKWRGLPDA